MVAVLAIAALALLAGLALVSLIQQRRTVALDKQQAEARSHTGDAQHNRSVSRRAAARSAPQPVGTENAGPAARND